MRWIFILLFTGALGFGLFQLWEGQQAALAHQMVRDSMDRFRPERVSGFSGVNHGDDSEAEKDSEESENAEEEPVFINQSILDAQLIYPDMVGWLMLDGTAVDYPFVQAADNDYYLRRDIDGKNARAGTLFMDYRQNSDFTDFVSTIYGHNMRNGTKFSSLKHYAGAEFFELNRFGTLFLAYATYEIEILAFMRVRNDNSMIFAVRDFDDIGRHEFIEYVKQNAIQLREFTMEEADRFVILSTCVNSAAEARHVLIGRLR